MILLACRGLGLGTGGQGPEHKARRPAVFALVVAVVCANCDVFIIFLSLL